MGLRPASSIPQIPLLGVSPTEESMDSPIDRRSDYYRQRARQKRPAQPQATSSGPPAQRLLTAPNVLTFLRVLLVPLLVVLWFHPHRLAPFLAAVTFIFAAITDWADGYIARRMKLTTALGAFLDPVADKLMVCTTLVLLAVSPPEPLSRAALAVPGVVMIGREIVMSALREWAAASGAGAHQAVKVNSLGKWKTAAQMVAMGALLLLRGAGEVLPGGGGPRAARAAHAGARASLALLWAGAFLAVWSLSNYMANVWVYFMHPPGLAASTVLSTQQQSPSDTAASPLLPSAKRKPLA